ncbi:uncharacterized protein LOC142523890 [Primulina tabacum]|uniref:uncharacterized protein LOC142523890 n=1 Tax=Primulina tabacum TaxID=48773 RepID=UPI003F59D39D
MKPGETLAEFDERFSSIIIEIISLGKEYSNREIALKVMRALPRECDVKTIAMRESKDLNKLELHDMFADLKAYEFELGIRNKDEPSKTQQTKALAAATVTLPVEESTSKKSAEQLSNEAMSLFVKKFSKFMRKNQSQMNKSYFKKDHTEDGQGCFNCGKKGHFIAECNRLKMDENKHENRRRFKDNKKFVKKKNQRVLIVEEDKGKWAETESEKSSSEASSSESEDETIECLMAKEDQESTDEMVFDFNSEEFTREDLVTALHDMVNEFKGLSIKFNEAVAKKLDLKNKLTLSNCSQHKEVESLKVKSSASLNKMHEMQKPAGDRTGLGYNINDCSTSEASTQPLLEKDSLRSIKFVRSSSSDKSKRYWRKPRPNSTDYDGSTGYHSRTRPNNYYNCRPVQKRYRLNDSNQRPKQHILIHHQIIYPIMELMKKNLEKSTWFLDSGCSRHMTGNKNLLSEVVNFKGPTITFGDNAEGKAMGKGKIIHGKIIIKDVLLVENLRYNMISISQLCDNGYTVEFHKDKCMVKTNEGTIVLTGYRSQNTYRVEWNDECLNASTCFIALNGNKNWLWHKSLNHLNFKSIATISKFKLVSGLPNVDFAKDKICNASQLGKQVRSTFKSKGRNSSARCLELLHMDLFGPIPVMSLGGKKYNLVVIDDFSRFTWVLFLSSKDQTADQLIKLLKRLQNEKMEEIDRIRSDRGTEFLNKYLSSYLEDHGIKHELSAARSPQQNGVAERRNRTLKEAARTMLAESGISQRFWAEAINTACYTQNRSMINKNHEKTPYEVWTGKLLEVGYFRIFGCKCFIHINGKTHLTAFDVKAENGIFLGYSAVSKAYRLYNQKTLTVEESIHVVFDESSICYDNSNSSMHDLINNFEAANLEASNDDDEIDLRRTGETISKENPTGQEQNQQTNEPENNYQPQNIQMEEEAPEQENDINQPTEPNPYRPCLRWNKDHPLELVIGNPTAPLRTRNQMINEFMQDAFVSQIEPKKIDDALLDTNWIEAMQEELNQFERNRV